MLTVRLRRRTKYTIMLETMSEYKETWFGERYSIVVDCMCGALSDGDIFTKNMVVG